VTPVLAVSESTAPHFESLLLSPVTNTHTDGFGFCSVFLSSSSKAAHLCRVFTVRVYGLTTPQETETPRRFPFRSIQRVRRLSQDSMDVVDSLSRLKQNHHILPSPPSPISHKRKYRAPSEATSPTDSTSAADFHPPQNKRTRFSSEESPESGTSRYDFRRRAQHQEPLSREATRPTGMPKSRYAHCIGILANYLENGTRKQVENSK
jgi:hypothetical protein